jgi:hypothetical protein
MRFTYLYFRLLEYVRDDPRQFGTVADTDCWIDDQTLLNFLAFRAQGHDREPEPPTRSPRYVRAIPRTSVAERPNSS